MFDVNVMKDRDITHTSPALGGHGHGTGAHGRARASASGRVAIYSENTVPPQDWDLLRMVLSHPATIAGEGRWQVNTPPPCC